MEGVVLPVGLERFGEIRRDNRYYIDKTQFIKELLNGSFKVMLITRPRRFGKTLMMSMLADFFDMSKDSREIFAGLAISESRELCQEWMNQWPVLFLTLKSVEGLQFSSAYAMLTALISDFCIANYYLLESQNINEYDRELFKRLIEKTATEEEIKNSLYTLSRMMQQHYGKPVILLIDEYDVPLARANENGYYSQMMEVIRSFIGKAMKSNPFLKFAVITGCLRIAKESIFTGTNNFVSNSVSDVEFSQYVGFTQQEVLKLLQDTGFSEQAEQMKRWYDGYLFGNTEIYCPWDVLNHVRRLQSNPKALPENYWRNTSHNGIIRSFIDRTDLAVNDKFEILLSGGYIQEPISEDLTYDVLHASESNLWSVLYLTGYLTRVNPENMKGEGLSETGKTCLRIPNEEIKTIFADTIAVWFGDTVKNMDRKSLFDAFWNGEEQNVTEMITDLLFDTISYYDYKEDYYHAFLTGIFTGAGYGVESNHEYGLGRPDIVIRDRKHRRAMLIEVKHSTSEEQLQQDCENALAQIDTRQYAKQFLKGYQTVVCYGAAFFEKECLIRKEACL